MKVILDVFLNVRRNIFQSKKALNCPELPKSSTITVRAGWIIDAIAVDGNQVGGNGGHPYVTELLLKEKVTAVEFGYHYGNGFWPTGTMCSLTIYTNVDDYGPYSNQAGCRDIQRVNVPAGMSFQKFMKQNAEETTDGNWGGTGVTINRN